MNKAVFVIIPIIAIAGGIAAYALSPYFTESSIDEAIPTGAITQPIKDSSSAMMEKSDESMTEEKMMMMDEEESMTEEKMMMMDEEESMTEEKMMMMDEEESMTEEKMMMMDEEESMTEEKMMMMDEEESMTEEKMMMMDEEDGIPMTYAGTFIGVGDGIHDAQGDAYTIPLEDGSNVLRLENFRSTNGPDLYVYLATSDNASDFVNLGQLKANKGNQNYDIPEGTDLAKYNKVLIWCKAFSVLFGSAEVLPQM